MRLHRRTNVFYMRNILIVGMMFCMVVLYVLWSSSTAASEDDAKPKLASVRLINDSAFVCNENFADTRKYFQNNAATIDANTDRPPLPSATHSPPTPPTIYFVTPTYPRREQIAELTRLGQTLMHVPHLHWIVADDFDGCNLFLDYLLNRFGIPYTHIASPMPDVYRTLSMIPRGVANRRAAINWIRTNAKRPGVLYFGDDDNTFDLKLFDEIRNTKRVSMFPVGLIGLYAISTPIVKEGKVIGFYDSWPANRLWPVDMAGFAVSLDYLWQSPNATMPYKTGYEEDEFLRSIGLKMADIEPLANNCSEVLVWHTQTKKEKVAVVRLDPRIMDTDQTSLGPLLRELVTLGVNHVSATTGITPQVSKNGKSKLISSKSGSEWHMSF